MNNNRTTDRAAGLIIAAVAFMIMIAPNAYSQAEPITISLSQPAQPMTLNIGILSANIQVIGERRNNVQIEVSGGDNGRRIVTPSGSKTVTSGSYNLTASEDNNVVDISSDWRMSTIDLVARIPANAALNIWTTSDGTIVVTGVTGEMQLQNTNGPVTVVGAVSAVIAESVNDNVNVAFTSLSDVSAASLTTLNGDVILGLPKQPAVQVQIDTSRGDIASDFEIDIQPSKPVVSRQEKDGKVNVSVENVIIANINGGGPVVRMKTLNGDVMINQNKQ